MKRYFAAYQRGFALIFAMFIVVLLLITSLLLLTNSQYTASDTHNSEARNQSFDAAEAGLNAAMDTLDASGSAAVAVGPTSGTVGSSTYKYWVYDNIGGGHQPSYAIGTDPASGNAVQSVPPGFAAVFAQGTGPNGIRSTEVMAIVAPVITNIQFPPFAMTANLDIAGNWNPKIGISGSAPGANDANIHANRNITANVGFLQGIATASGGTNSLNGSPSGVNTAQVSLPTSQIGSFVTLQKGYSSASPNVYIANGGTLGAAYTCPAGTMNGAQSGCVLFVDGPIHMSGLSSTTFIGQWIAVINGDFQATGQSSITFQTGQKSVFVVNGNADIGGNGNGAATLWSKGDTTLHGNGFMFGKIVAGGSINLLGGGARGGFQYDKTLDPMTLATKGNVAIKSWAEY